VVAKERVSNLKQVAERINEVVGLIKETFTVEELKDFLEYVNRAEIVGPFFSFDQWRELASSDAFSKARKRAKYFLEIKEEEGEEES